MLELGLSELFLVGIVSLIIVGPKDLPRMFRVVGKYVGRAKAMARDFQRSFEDAAKDTGYDDIKKSISSLQDFSPNNIAKTVVKDNAHSDKVGKTHSSANSKYNIAGHKRKELAEKVSLSSNAKVKNLSSGKK